MSRVRGKQNGNSSPSQRQLRVGERIKQVLGEALVQGLLDSKSNGQLSLTITEVRPSPDLRHAKVYFLPFVDSDLEAVTEALEASRLAIGKLLGRHMQTRFTPRLSFHHDTHFEKAQKLESMLRDVRIPPEV